jgi:hypothetical protein
MGLALRASARAGAARFARLRLLAGAAFPPALLALAVPVTSYYESFHDLPWGVVFPVGLLLGLGGWRWGQRWLALLVLGLAWIWSFGASLPPSSSGLPRSATNGDLTLTVRSLTRSQNVVFCDFDLKTRSGRPIAEQYLIEKIRGEGRVWPGWPVTVWSPHPWPDDPGDPENEARLSAYTFPPGWARSFELTFQVAAWPSQSHATLVLPVPPAGGEPEKSYTANADGIQFTVSDLRWTRSQGEWPLRPVLALKITRRGDVFTPATRHTLRFTDEQGRVLETRGVRFSKDQSGSVEDLEVPGLPRGVCRLRVDAFSEQQLQQGERVFRFPRLPNPASGP